MRNINMHDVVEGLGYKRTDLDSIRSIEIDVETGVIRIGRCCANPDTGGRAFGPTAPLVIYDVFNLRAGYDEQTQHKPWLDPSVPEGPLPKISRATFEALCELQRVGVSHDIPRDAIVAL